MQRLVPFLCLVLVVILLLNVLFLNTESSSANVSSIESNSRKSAEERRQRHVEQSSLAQLHLLNATLSTLNTELRAILASQQDSFSKSQQKATATSLAAKVPALSSSTTTPVAVAETMMMTTSSGKKRKTAILFTMDSISSYEENSRRGGASGEILIRHSLESAFRELHVDLRVARSDAEFEKLNARLFDFIILDPWTWAAQGWVPKASIRGLDEKIFILDFFGSEKLRGSGLNVRPERFLTAFGSAWNTFLGFELEQLAEMEAAVVVAKSQSGVVWGKDVKHFDGKIDMLLSLANEDIHFVSVSTSPVLNHPNFQWVGHQTPDSWRKLLLKSKFLLGLGDPLLGPSAIDAIASGCMFINPIYSKPAKNGALSQHPYAADKIGPPHVCSYKIDDKNALKKCLILALNTNLTPYVPPDFTREAHISRVKSIFDL